MYVSLSLIDQMNPNFLVCLYVKITIIFNDYVFCPVDFQQQMPVLYMIQN